MTNPYLSLIGGQSPPPKSLKPANPYAALLAPSNAIPSRVPSLATDGPLGGPLLDEPGNIDLSSRPKFQQQIAAPDATRFGAPPGSGGRKITTPIVSSVLKYAVDPMLNNPLQTTLMAATGPLGAAVATAGMGKDVAQYAGQKAAELSLPRDVRQMAERDPSRISGEQAAVEGAMLALPLLGKAAHAVAGRERAAPVAKPTLEPPAPTVADIATENPQRNVGLSFADKTRDNIRNAYRSALVTPYAAIEQQAPALADALLSAGASKARAQHIASVRMERVLGGLTDQQKADFGTKLVHDNLLAEADRKGQAASQTSDPAQAATLVQAAQNFEAHAQKLAPRVVPDIDQQPWFQKALGQYKTDIEGPLTKDALSSGVDPASLRQPATAYVRLASDARLNDAEIRRALDVSGVGDPSQLRQRPALLAKLIGENPALKNYFARNAEGARQGPLQSNAGYPGEPGPINGKRVSTSGSSKMAQGTAQDYTTDLSRIVDFDARDKAVKAARNRIYAEVANAGRQLADGEAPAPGKKALAFSDQKGLVTGDAGALRYEVSPEVADAVEHFHRGQQPPSTARQFAQKASDFMTRAQIAGMPVEAMSHANTEATLVSKVPGEKDVIGKAIAAIPGIGGKAASIREMLQIKFSDPAIQQLENRLADVGALRIKEPHSGLINQSHNFLFGPTGVDKRARLVLARKLLDREPNATDAQLREFINSQVGNYNAQNAGAVPNFMAKGSFLSPFARFQSARIPTSIKRTVGVSDLPSSSLGQKVGTAAQTLYRGPIGYTIGANLLNYALTGHGTKDNDPGNALNVGTGLYAVPGGMKRMTKTEAEAYGDKAQPIYLPAATLDPVTYAGLRATGLRAMIRSFSPEQPNELRGDNAVRDMTNVALGTAGPMMRALQTAFTGTQPFLQNDGSFLRVAPRRMGSDFGDRLSTAMGLANPAVHAFTSSGGDASRTLASAMAEDGKPFGGPASLAARIAEFTMPRLLAPTIGGRTNEQSADVQLDRRYRDALADYSSRIKRAPGPIAQDAIMAEARRDARRNGFDPEVVTVALQKIADQDHGAVASKQDQQLQRRLQKIRP